MTDAPTDQELVEALGSDHGLGEIAGISRQPYRYATSAPLEQVRIEIAGGVELDLILKDLSRERLIGDAATKPEFLHRPEREIETYRGILTPEGIGPRCVAAVAEPAAGRYWLLLEKVPGVELWQIGELSTWEEVARWLGRFHSSFQDRVDQVRASNPHLLDLSEQWFETWCRRALERLARSEDERAGTLREALEGYGGVARALAAIPLTFVHGELYPSNVIVVQGESPRICPVDWEMAATGPGLVDLAALVGGWDEPDRLRLADAYLSGLGGAREPGELDDDLARCRLHLALQWLGWSADWRPPPEHAHDWLGEALELASRVGLSDRGRG